MSAYMTLATPMIDQECLLDALVALGFDAANIEVHAEPAALIGYEGGRRGQRANIVIRREHVGRASNDIGFLATATGYRAFISDYDQTRYGKRWLTELHERYQSSWRAKMERLAEQERRRVEQARRELVEAQRQAIHRKARKLGYRVRETREQGKLRLVLVKRVY